MAKNSMQSIEWIRNQLEEHGEDLVREMLKLMAQTLMSAESDAMCGAAFGERSPERVNHRNGYRDRRWDTRVGSIDLSIPRLRKGTYFPSWLLEPRRRSERALMAVIAESYVLGVSTRRVEDLVQTMGIAGISKSQVSEIAATLDEAVGQFLNRPLGGTTYRFVWLDALAIRCREAGRVANVHCVIAIGVSASGQREILGLDVVTEEDGAGWLGFLRGLVSRGLKGVELTISDAHLGLKDAIAAVFPGAAWQRCRTHFMRNLLAKVPKAAQQVVASLVRSIFAQPDAESVWTQHTVILRQLEQRFPKAAEALEDAADDILAFTHFPKTYWRQIWSNNPLERLNKEIRRRTDVVGIFPNRDAITRLVGALLAEQNDEWATTRRYMTFDAQIDLVPQPSTLTPPGLPKEADALAAAG